MKIITDAYNAGYEDAQCNHANEAQVYAHHYLYSRGLDTVPMLIREPSGYKVISLEWLGHRIDRYDVYNKCIEKLKEFPEPPSPQTIARIVIEIIENI